MTQRSLPSFTLTIKAGKTCIMVLWMAVSLLVPHQSRGEQDLVPIIELEMQVAEEGARSQQVVSNISGDIQKLLETFRATIQQTESLGTYNKELRKLIGAQQSEMFSIERQIGRASGMEREIVPLMTEMFETLEQFIVLDLPFLMDERRSRLKVLRGLMDRADVATSEKYRRIIETYQIESEYGRTIEAYQASIDLPAGSRTVDVLRVGRIALLYRGLGGDQTGFWNQDAQEWQLLPDQYDSALRRGIMIARKQAAPELLEIPLPVAPIEVRQ